MQKLEGDKAQLQSRLSQLTGEIDTHTKTISEQLSEIGQHAAKLQAKDTDATKTALTKAEAERDAARKVRDEKEALLKE